MSSWLCSSGSRPWAYLELQKPKGRLPDEHNQLDRLYIRYFQSTKVNSKNLYLINYTKYSNNPLQHLNSFLVCLSLSNPHLSVSFLLSNFLAPQFKLNLRIELEYWISYPRVSMCKSSHIYSNSTWFPVASKLQIGRHDDVFLFWSNFPVINTI